MRPLRKPSISAASSTKAPRAVLIRIDARLHARDLRRAEKTAGLVVERKMQRDHVGARQQFVERDERLAGLRRAVPGDHLHAEAAADAHHLAADAAEPDDAERLAVKLHAFARRPGAGADLTIHARDVAARGQHQRDGVLGDRGVAVALDGVDANAARLELGDVHVARRAGAEKDDVLERVALRDQFGRHVGVVVDADVVAVQQPRQLGALERLDG